MTTADKKQKIRDKAIEMLRLSLAAQILLVDKALTSGAIDIDAWDENSEPMITPKVIVVSVLESEADQYKCQGTRFEKKMNKDIKNLKYFL